MYLDNIKFLRIFFLIFIIFVCSTEQKRKSMKDLEKIGEECLKETGMKRHLVICYRDTQKFSMRDKTYMEFLNCSYKKQGYQDENGHILFDNIKEFLIDFYTPEQVDIVLESCKSFKRRNAGETAFFVMRCILDNLNLLEADMMNDVEIK